MSGWLACREDTAGDSREIIRVHDAKTCLAVPDLGRLGVAGAKDVDRAVASVAVHGFNVVVDETAHDAPLFRVQQVVVDDQRRIEFGLLLLVLDDVGREGRSIEILAQFDAVELRTTYRTTVGSLDPRPQTRVVHVVSTRE